MTTPGRPGQHAHAPCTHGLFRIRGNTNDETELDGEGDGRADDRLGLIMTIKRHTSPNWRSFLEARAFARSKELTNQAEWFRFCRSGDKPDDIPTNPNQTYKAEWRGFGDWLGTGAVAPRDRQYRSFQAARAFVRSKGLTNQAEWRAFCRSGDKPDDIPAAPEKVYKAEWRGTGDWLGTGAVAPRDRQYRSFQAARAFVRSKGLTNQAEWRAFCRSGDKPDDIPALLRRSIRPSGGGLATHKGFGTGAVAPRDRPQYRSFQAARAFVRSKGLTNQAEWRAFCRSGDKPDDIPATPNVIYKAEWRGMADWLGTDTVAPRDRQYRSFQAARAFVRSKGVTSHAEWRAFCRSGDKPDDIPAAPQKVYKAEWRGFGDWLGTGAVAPRDRQFRSFQAARAFVRSKGGDESR